MANREHIQTYQSRRNGEFGWRLVAANGKRIAIGGETFKNRRHAEKMATRLFPGRSIIHKGIA